jgi:hypothetical protein
MMVLGTSIAMAQTFGFATMQPHFGGGCRQGVEGKSRLERRGPADGG